MKTIMDLVYFGYECEDDSYKNQVEFIKDIEIIFPDIKFKDAFDYIKGYRQEVVINIELKDEYYAWIIANGWYDASLTTSLILMDAKQKDEASRLIQLAQETYPNNFKN